MTSVGFDTIVINNRYSDNTDLRRLFDFFLPMGIVNFIFPYRFDLSVDNITLSSERLKNFTRLAQNVAPRGVHVKAAHALCFIDGVSQNRSLEKFCLSKKKHSEFFVLPLFSDPSDNRFATELNRLLYRRSIFPIFNSFDSIVKTAPRGFCSKLLCSNSAGFVLDINFLFDLENTEILNLIVKNSVQILPSISHGLENYVGIQETLKYFIQQFGKNNYYKLCSQINKCSNTVGF